MSPVQFAEINDKMASVDNRLTRMETLVGDSPEEGMRAEFSAMRRDVNALKKHLYLALGGGAVIYWLLSTAAKHGV